MSVEAYQPLCLIALNSNFFTRSRPLLQRMIYCTAGLVHKLAAITIIPAAGVLYHSFQAIRSGNAGNKEACWKHLKAAAVDAAVAFVGISLTYIAIKALMAMPTVLKEMSQFKDMALTPENILAYDAVRVKFNILCTKALLPFVVPISYTMLRNAT